MKKTILLIVIISAFCNCRKDVSVTDDYFAFGAAGGGSSTFYLIQYDNLYPSDMDYGYSYVQPTPLKFKKAKLPADKYNLALVIQRDLPQFLKDHPNTTFGCPDCLDQGGLHIEIKENGVIKRWHLDVDDKTPEVVKTYMAEMDSILFRLQ